MPPRRFPPGDSREWLNRARSHLTRAKTCPPGVYLEDLCFDAQQAAEKAIKAVFIHNGLDFPYVHDLTRLLTLLERTGRKIPKYVREAGRLTRFAVETRYPGLSERVSGREHAGSVRVAEGVLRWAARQVGEKTRRAR